jgi:tRNA(fMet)-specific endonuclease VapC
MFMLDTDSVSFALRGQGNVASRIAQRRPSELCISAITVAELRFGADRRKSTRIHQLIDLFTATLAVVPFDETCAARYGVIASELARRGTPIGQFDVLIAAHALTIRATLVTNNVKHFSRVRGLEVENWL